VTSLRPKRLPARQGRERAPSGEGGMGGSQVWCRSTAVWCRALAVSAGCCCR
jgi:hypothetical protein